MSLQDAAAANDGLKIPRIVPFLADTVCQLNGQQSEGIFRVPGDADDVTDLVSALWWMARTCSHFWLISVYESKTGIMMLQASLIPMYLPRCSSTGFETLPTHWSPPNSTILALLTPKTPLVPSTSSTNFRIPIDALFCIWSAFSRNSTSPR